MGGHAPKPATTGQIAYCRGSRSTKTTTVVVYLDGTCHLTRNLPLNLQPEGCTPREVSTGGSLVHSREPNGSTTSCQILARLDLGLRATPHRAGRPPFSRCLGVRRPPYARGALSASLQSAKSRPWCAHRIAKVDVMWKSVAVDLMIEFRG